MSTPFIKAIALTILIVVQTEFTDMALSYARNINLPIELAVFISLCTFMLGFAIYRAMVKQGAEKHKPPQSRNHHTNQQSG